MVSKDNNKNGGDSSRPIQIGFSAETREIDQGLDLNELLIQKPSATFFFRLSESIKGDLELHPDDILVVDRSEIPRIGSVVVFSCDDGFLIGKCGKSHYEIFRSTPRSSSLTTANEDLMVWGVVTGMVRYMKGGV